ncbi:MAG: hypothetical protein ACU0DH_07115 [Paracoccus sp. (in: a-proteobacteria)]|uniref:hypothetical protein n=1 Tax=Paracoccus sp. TaxID=267 RepID=UPI002E89C990|nr:hypothetical protein [Pseudomonadota bacterium]
MLTFEDHGVRGGIWRGCLRGDQAPSRVVLVQHGEILAEVVPVAERKDAWHLALPLPAEVLTSGVQTLLLKLDDGAPGEDARPDGQVLARLALMAGRALDADLMAEVATLRAELELVKRELRRFAADHARR